MEKGTWEVLLDDDCVRCKKFDGGKCPIVHKHRHMGEELSDPNRFKGRSKILCEEKVL